MITLGLHASELRALRTALLSTGSNRISVSLLDLEHNHLADLTPYLIDGQVDLDTSDSNATRKCNVTLSDPNRNLPFDTDSPASTALFMDRMIRVYYEVIVNGDWVAVPVFTGPIAGSLDRTGDQVTATCYGKEWLAMGSAWHGATFKKSYKKTSAINNIMNDLAGEANYYLDIPDLSYRLPKPYVVHRFTTPWAAAKSLAHGMNKQLFYDGRGHCRLRGYPGNVAFAFNDDSSITSPIQITYSGDVVNTVEVIGATPKGSKTPVSYVAVAPRTHPLSPERLGRNGVPRYLMKDNQAVQDDHIKTSAEAKALAVRLLNDQLVEQVDVQFSCLPGAVVLLDPSDLCHVSSEDGSVTFRLGKFSLPLKAGESASVGYHKNTNVARTKRRHRR